MRMITPITITNDVLVSSSVSENDHAEWDVGTTYAAEDRVIVIGTTHKIYESAQGGNTGNNPVTDDGTWWIEVSATNRWKAFDQKLADQVSDTTSIQYVLSMPSNCTGLAIFNPECSTINVTVEDGSSTIYDQTFDGVDFSDITDWLEYFTVDLENNYKPVFILSVPAYTNNTVTITISSASGQTVKVGEIVIGYVEELGQTNYGTSVSILDFSTKDTDTFGNFIIVERVFRDEVNFQFQLLAANVGKVKKKLAARRAKPTVYFSDFNQEQYGAVAYGYYEDFDLPLSSPSLCTATLDVRGLG